MGGFTVNTSGLMSCQQAIGQEVGQFGGLADSLSHNHVSRSDFGSLPVSAQLAQLTEQVNDAARRQLGAAEKFLSGAETALDQVLENYLGADQFAVLSAAEAVGAPVQSVINALER